MRKRVLTTATILLSLLALPVMAQDLPAPEYQRLEHVLRWSWQNNPNLTAARAQLDAVREALPQAQAGWKPSVSADANITKAEIDGSAYGDGTTSKDVGVSMTQPVWRGGRTAAEISAARRLIDAQEAILAQSEQEIMLAVATAYMDVVRDRALLDLSMNNRDVIQKQFAASSARFEVGEITKTDVSQAQARLARAEAGVTAARGNLAGSRAAYEELTGMTPVNLGAPQVNFPLPATINDAIAAADGANPRIKAAIAVHQASLNNANAAIGNMLPEVNAFASWDRAYDPQPGFLDDTTTKAVGLRASVPLYTGGANLSRVRQARHTAERRYDEVSAVKRRVRQAVISAWEDLAAARAEINSREAQAEAAKLARDGVHQEADLGARTILDALDADQEYMDAEAALVTARRNEVVASFALAEGLGLLTPEVIGFPKEDDGSALSDEKAGD